MKPTQARAIEPPPPAAHEIASPLTRGHEALAVGTVDSRLANAQVRYRNVAEGLGDAILRWEDRVTVTLARVQKLMAQVKAAKTPPQHRGPPVRPTTRQPR